MFIIIFRTETREFCTNLTTSISFNSQKTQMIAFIFHKNQDFYNSSTNKTSNRKTNKTIDYILE